MSAEYDDYWDEMPPVRSLTTEAQMVLETLASEQPLHTFIALLTGLGLEDVVGALEEITSAAGGRSTS